MSALLSTLLALLLDYRLGEPQRLHPLIGFGNLADGLESWLNNHQQATASRWWGLAAWALAVLPLTYIAFALSQSLADNWLLHTLVSGVVLYLAIGWHSLVQHAQEIYEPLQAEDLPQARQAVSYIVSRDCQQLNAQEVATAATESVLENGADAIFAALFWFLLAGIPGVVLYRLSNTLDAMWGYKNQRFLHFGWAAARLDDLLNFIPARLTALTYTLCGHRATAWRSWRRQAGTWKSPNAGPVMAAGAGALQVQLGGPAPYHGTMQERPLLGEGQPAQAQTIDQACKLIARGLVLWVCIITAGNLW
ncbi:MAG: adenosylcobinamide-phosphate synthase CbiB [Gammaproteobacteria bacterium]|nr:adenosylcobinamide-phosphate synthase CbiB [Gammaproteobacteria bacterium]